MFEDNKHDVEALREALSGKEKNPADMTLQFLFYLAVRMQ